MRTDGRETGLTRVPVELLRAAEQNFLDAIRIFDALISKITEGQSVPHAEVEKSAQAFHGATTAFFRIRRAIDEQAAADNDPGDDTGLDLAEARDRVSRLLDRLRSSGPSDEVP